MPTVQILKAQQTHRLKQNQKQQEKKKYLKKKGSAQLTSQASLFFSTLENVV